MRTPKLQIAAEQPSTGECWIPPKTDTPCPRAKGKTQKDGRRGKITFRIKPSYPSEMHRGLKQNLVHKETESELCLSVSCGGRGQQWPATGAGALGAADLGVV